MAKRKEVEALQSIARPGKKEPCTDLVQTLAYDVNEAIQNYENSVESQWRLEDETYKTQLADLVLSAKTVKLGDEVPELNEAAEPSKDTKEMQDPKAAEKDDEKKDPEGEKQTGMREGPAIENVVEEKTKEGEKTGGACPPFGMMDGGEWWTIMPWMASSSHR